MVTYDDLNYWRWRGRRDAERLQGSMFRKVGTRYVSDAGDPPADWTADDEDAIGRAYRAAYDAFDA